MQSLNLSYALAAAAALTLTIPAAMAGGSADAGLKTCAVVRDAGARLSCYDKLAASLMPHTAPVAKAASVTPPPATAPAPAAAPAPVAVTPTAPAAQRTTAQFGSELLPVPKVEDPETKIAKAPKAIDHITAEVSDVAYSLRKRFTVFLANGQIWKQSESDAERASFPRHGKVMVTITRGMVGGYNLTINDSDKVYKVNRVK